MRKSDNDMRTKAADEEITLQPPASPMQDFCLINANASVMKTIHELIFSSIKPRKESRQCRCVRHVYAECADKRGGEMHRKGGGRNEAACFFFVLKLDEEEMRTTEPRRGGAGVKEVMKGR